MDSFDLKKMVKEIHKYFKDQKVPADDVLELWLDEVEHIPAISFDWIVDNIKQRKSLPGNLPRIIKEAWEYYIRAHPNQFTQAEEFPEKEWNCPDCHATGVLHFKAVSKLTGLKYTFVAVCGTCDQGLKMFGSAILAGTARTVKHPDSGKNIPFGEPLKPVLRLTKQDIIDKGYEFMPAFNRFERPIRPGIDELTHGIGKPIPGGLIMSEEDKEHRRADLLDQAQDAAEDEFKEVNEIRDRILKRHGRSA